MRMRTIGLILIIVVGAIALFGFLGMAVIPAESSCPISAILGGNCPPTDNALALVSHHISGLQSFTQSIFTLDFSLSLILFSFIFGFVLFLYREPSILHNFLFRFYQTKHRNFNPKRQLLRWLSFLNNRDPHVLNVGA